LTQIYENIEIILVDDGSPDSSPGICDRYSEIDRRIKVVHIKNAGVSNARNVGLEKAYGEYLCFVDSDDYVSPNYVQNFVDGLTPSVDLVFQGINEVLACGKIIEKKPLDAFYGKADILDGISDINKYAMFGYVCNKLYRRSIICENGLRFSLDIDLSEDRIFALQYMVYVNEMRTVAKSAYFYEMLNTGLTLRKRSYDKLKLAADENLKAAMVLLASRKSKRFERDSKRFYIASATGYLLSLFYNSYTFKKRNAAIADFCRNYKKWMNLYVPISTDQKVLYNALKCSSVICVIVMQVYLQVKKIKNVLFAKSCF
jgi:glycosyltransferase involved in cell wall biosynthesis